MTYVRPVLLLICQLSVLSLAYEYDLPSEPYCGKNNTCCSDREDRCSHIVISPEGNTICYCDEFCNRPDGRGDCCDDYFTVCLGITTTPEPTTPTPSTPTPTTPTPTTPTPTTPPPTTPTPTTPTPSTPPPTETTPTVTETTPEPGNISKLDCRSCDDDQDEECSKYRCIIEDKIIEQVNNDANLTWRASSYSQFAGKKLEDGRVYKLGTFKRSPRLSRMGAERYTHDDPYLKEFNAKLRWPHLISPIADQGWCGSDWAVSLATIVSDRFAIQSNGAEKVQLSPQTLLSCNTRRQKGCKGGHIDTAWRFAQIHGLVTEECFSYKANQTSCPYKPDGDLEDDGCPPLVKERKERYRVGPPIRLAKERDVMYDIIHSGPIQMMMEVYQDFFHYKSGIYRHSKYGDQSLKGYHSVRLLGWGEENGQRYWIVANSWGTAWGENGFFRIARGDNECDIETFMVTVLCDVTESLL